MEKTAPPDTLAVAGDKLKQAREARGMSVNDMAGTVTLSREQVRALEDGGNLPFYTAAHKRLALKKYASALGIPLSEVIIGTDEVTLPGTDPLPVDAAPLHAGHGTPADLRLAAAERNARLRQRLLTAAVAIAVLLAVYAKQRGAVEAGPPTLAVEVEADPLPAATEPVSIPVVQTQTVAAVPGEAPDAPFGAPADTPPASVAAAGGPACSLPPQAEVPAWSPPYQRKPDTRVFFVSSKAIEVCIADASGKPALILLKPNIGQAFTGKPPFLVRADELASVDIYLQGMRARVPSDVQALRLIPTNALPPAEVAASQASE